MKKEDKDRILATVSELQAGILTLSPQQAEGKLMEVLKPLLEEDGYTVMRTASANDGGMDFLAEREATTRYERQTLGIEFKYYRAGRLAGSEQIRQILGAALLRDVDRAILLTNTGYTESARTAIRRELPLQIELMDLDSLMAWASRVEEGREDEVAEVREILRAASRRFATLIAKDPRSLDHIEWRDLERIVAEVFDGIGFKVTLTPSSKDGGKDIVLECHVRGHRAEYIVEIKHWRSRVGGGALRDFVKVVACERRSGGLFLSTNGYTHAAFEQLSEVERQRVRFGNQEKIVALCRTYLRVDSGIWSPPENLVDVLYEGTLGIDSSGARDR